MRGAMEVTVHGADAIGGTTGAALARTGRRPPSNGREELRSTRGAGEAVTPKENLP